MNTSVASTTSSTHASPAPSSSGPAPWARRIALAAGLIVASGAASAAVPFTAVVDGRSLIVELIDPAGPVVRVETHATGGGTPGTLAYHSGDVLNLGTGQGTGTNRFVTEAGDELFGSFSVQFVPGADPSLFSLVGEVVFTGGTGAYQGATGGGSFLGSGQFISASEALTHFSFDAQVSSVPEPASAGLFGLGLAGCLAAARRRWNEGGRRAG